MREYQDFVELELPVLPDDFAKDFEADRDRGHDESAPVTVWTVLAQDMLQAFASSLARHLDQTERRHRRDLVTRVVAQHGLFENLHHAPAMLFLFHIDEID